MAELEKALNFSFAFYRDERVQEILAQDLGYQAYNLLRQLAGPQRPNDLFIVGDPNQRIYGKQASLGLSGIDIRGRSKKLRINYRTTEEIRKAAVSALQATTTDDLNEGSDDQKGYHSLMHGPSPRNVKSKTFEDEIKFISQYLIESKNDGIELSDICLVSRTRDYCDQIIAELTASGIQCIVIESDSKSADKGVVKVATLHRVKGLEFDRVLIVGLGTGKFPAPVPTGFDAVAKGRWEARERALLYVAMTRARRELILCHRLSSP